MRVFNNRFYIIGFISLVIMGGVVIYTFRTIFSSLTLAFEVDTAIPESELRINRQNLDRAYDFVYDSEPTKIDLNLINNNFIPQDEESETTQQQIEGEQSN